MEVYKMGRFKHFLETHEYAPIDKTVCANCFEDYAIKEFINSRAENKKCDYCGIESKDEFISVGIEDVIDLIRIAIDTEWDKAVETLPYESREGGYLSPGEKLYLTYELLKDAIELIVEGEELFNDILSSVDDETWVKKNPFELSTSEKLIYSWDIFTEQIKYKARYFFTKLKTVTDEERLHHKAMEPFEVLENLSVLVIEMKLLDIIKEETNLYRVRLAKENDNFTTVRELGPPDIDHTMATRMSPDGITVFYGSFSNNTAKEEQLRRRKTDETIIVSASFKSLRKLKVLNLNKIPQLPSLFDMDRNHLRHQIKFLINFRNDIGRSIDIEKDYEREYIPSQAMTEYFKLVFKDGDGSSLDGIIYPSSVGNDSNIVLFFTQENCINENETPASHNLWQQEKVLQLINSQIISEELV
jgi:HEPN superfamily RES-like protein/RES domain-containing protein